MAKLSNNNKGPNMNNSLYKFTLYFFFALFISSCGMNLFDRSQANDNKSEDLNSNQITEQTEAKITEINKAEIIAQRELDNVSSVTTENLQEIALLKSKVKYLEQEYKSKGEASTIFNNPYALFNQQIIMDNGTIYYGSVIYQDEQYVTIETLIGKLNLERNRIIRVLSHHLEEDEVPAFPELDFSENIVEDGDVLYKSPANIVLANNINTTLDETGNTVLSGQLQNIGGRRADFVKIHMTLYRDWSQTLEPKTFTIFASGTTHYFDGDSTKISDSSIEPKALADFSLTIPRNFGNVISWTYDIDFEAY